jgi:hypothetical protein
MFTEDSGPARFREIVFECVCVHRPMGDVGDIEPFVLYFKNSVKFIAGRRTDTGTQARPRRRISSSHTR